MNNIVKTFNDVRAFVKYLDDGETQSIFVGHCSSKTGGYSFTHSHSYEEANELLAFGDKELAKKIEDAGVKIARSQIKNTAPKRMLYTSVVGCAPNVPAYISGAPNSMINMRLQKTKMRTMSILFNARVNCTITPKQIIESSSKILSAILNIESSGTRVELLYAAAVSAKGQNVMPVVKIKNCMQPLDVFKAAYIFAHPSMFRRHVFRFLEVTEGVSSDFRYVYGYGCDEQDVRKMMQQSHIEKSILLTLEDVLDMTAEEVKQYVIVQASK